MLGMACRCIPAKPTRQDKENEQTPHRPLRIAVPTQIAVDDARSIGSKMMEYEATP
jgi:hypothetical protein